MWTKCVLCAAAVTPEREITWKPMKLCCYDDRNRSTMARTRWPTTATSKKFLSRSTETRAVEHPVCPLLVCVMHWSALTSCFLFSDTCVSQAFIQKLPISSGSTVVALGTSRSNCGRSNYMPGTPLQRKARTRPSMSCKTLAHILHVVSQLLAVLMYDVFTSPSPTSEELNLDDVMDIELDFPTITDAQNTQTSLPIHSLSVEVSGSH